MSTRHDRGRRRSQRSSHDDDGEEKTNADYSSTQRPQLHSHRRYRHSRPVHDSSEDRSRGRERDPSSPEEQNQVRRRRRRRPQPGTRHRRTERGCDGHDYDYDEDFRRHHDEDHRRQKRRTSSRRQLHSTSRRSKKRQRQRSPSPTSLSSQDSHYNDRRRSHRGKLKKSHRSRRSRSRNNSATENEYDRLTYYHSRGKEHDTRLKYYHHHNRNPLHDGVARHMPPAGVVSDDEDGHHSGQQHGDHSKKYTLEETISSRKHPSSQMATNREGNIPATTGSNNINNLQRCENGSKSDTKNNFSKKHPKSSPPSSNVQDDTIGHFKGRDGCVIADRYRILKEVGVGTFGRVVECLDIKLPRERQSWEDSYRREKDRSRHYHQLHHSNRDCHRDNPNNIVAIKIVRNVKRYYDSAKIEAQIIEDVNRRGRRGTTHCAKMYRTFSFDGHYCMVFESLGPSLYDFLKGQKYHPFPIGCIRDFARQLLETLEYLHSFQLIHTDLKPENILLINGRQVQRGGYSIPESTRIKVIDFGGATYDNEKKSSIVNTRQYRAPEVILGVGWSMPSDLWSVGCILAELYQGELLFATHDNIEHLALIERVVGPFPRKMLKRAKNIELVEDAFDSNGSHRMDRVLSMDKLSYVEGIAPLESIICYDDDEWFLRLLRRVLIINPDERATAQECLRKF